MVNSDPQKISPQFLSREEFAAAYAKRSGITVESLLNRRTIEPCPDFPDCYSDACNGWICIPKGWLIP